GFAVQWAIGDGAPVVFKATSIVLYTLATLAVWRLARRLLAPSAAWVAAALFAVHPVHVEAVAGAVNEGELVVAIILCWLTAAWIDRRRANLPLTPRGAAVLLGGMAVGILFKEHALMLVGLIGLAELLLINDERPWRTRLLELRPLLLRTALVV